MKRFIPLVLLAAIAGAYYGYQHYLSLRPFQWSGTVEARTVTVGSRTGGRVAKVLVKEGDAVKVGDPLIVLEPGDLEAQRAIARAQLAQADATFAKLKAGARPEEIAQAKARSATAAASLAEVRSGTRSEEIAAGVARLEQAQAAVDKAQLDADRARKLLAMQAIPAAESDGVEAALRSASAARDAQKKVLDELRAGARYEQKVQAAARADEAEAAAKLVIAGARVEDLRAAEAAVEGAKARLDQLAVATEELTVKASVPARVEALELRPGDLLAPSAPAVTLLEDDQLYVRIYVPETQVGRVKIGDEVPISVDSFAKTFKGKVEFINNRGEYSPRNLQTADQRADQVFAARIGLVDGRGELRAGMAATVEVAK